MMKKMMMGSMLLASMAFAQSAVEKAPVYKANSVLGCPSGTKQIGAPTGGMSAMACMKFAASGLRVFHGPMVSFYNSGKVEAVGQMDEGMRTGKWVFFDETGHKTGETEFAHGEYHGRRVEFLADGKLKFEENWVNGKRQGVQKQFDANGVATLTEYRDDRPVQK
ncbi:MAG: hypothetical protein QM817_15715 [Archangium sp.]